MQQGRTNLREIAALSAVVRTIVDGIRPWTETPDAATSLGPLLSQPLGGDAGAPVTLASGQGGIENIVVDDTSAYWTDFTSGTVMKLTPKVKSPAKQGSSSHR